VAPRAGLAWASSFKGLGCQTAVRGRFDPQRHFGALSNLVCPFKRALVALSWARTVLRGRGCVLSLWMSSGGGEKSEINPLNRTRLLQALHDTPRCNAKTRAGTPCQCPAIRGRKRCRLHGGLSPGAPKGSQNGNYTNGDWTREALEERRWVRDLVRSFGKLEAI
jgi:hypothetical protein